MATILSDNFNFIGNKPNFERDWVNSFSDLTSTLKIFDKYEDGHLVYCKANKTFYKYDKGENPETSEFKEFKTGTDIDINDYYTKTDIDDLLKGKLNTGNYATTSDLSTKADVSAVNLKADKTELNTKEIKASEDIIISGGPLSDLVTKAGIKTIKANDSVLDILLSLLCKESLPSSAGIIKLPSFKAKYNAPTVEMRLFSGGILSDTVEVGTEYKLTKASITSPVPIINDLEYSGFDYGYSKNLDSEVIEGNPSSVSWTHETLPASETSKYSLKITSSTNIKKDSKGIITNVALENLPTSDVENTELSKVEILEIPNLVVSDGSNSVTYKVTGPGMKGSFAGSPKYYVASNLGKVYETKPKGMEGGPATVGKVPADSTEIKTAKGSKTLSVTGQRKAFFGNKKVVDSNDSVTSSFVRQLGEGVLYKDFKDNKDLKVNDGDMALYICIPDSWGKKLKSAINIDNNQNVAATFEDGKITVNVEGNNNYTAVPYTVYRYLSKTKLGTSIYKLEFE